VRAPGVWVVVGSTVAVVAVVRVAHPLSCSYRSFVWLFHTALDPAERWQVCWLTLWLRRPAPAAVRKQSSSWGSQKISAIDL
jgi:hypothetical protein